MIRNSDEFRIPNYNIVKNQGHINRRAHGGTAILIHESIPYHALSLDTELEATAITANLNGTISVCSLYSSRNHNIPDQLLNNLLQELPKPVIILGDINSYNPLWGSNNTDARGRIFENFLTSNNLLILNDSRPTRVACNTETAIDVTITTPGIAANCHWDVLPSPRDSDHCPIMVTLLSNRPQTPFSAPVHNTRRANWETFSSHPTW